MIEEFRDLPNYEGIYQVSNLGRIKSLARKSLIGRVLKEKILKPFLVGGGYLSVSLHKEGKQYNKQAHKLVAIAFLNHTPNGNKIVVDHIDNDKTNNKLSNLQLISNRENLSKDKKGCSSKYTGVSWNKSVNKWVANITINGKVKYLGYYTEELEAAKAYQNALNAL